MGLDKTIRATPLNCVLAGPATAVTGFLVEISGNGHYVAAMNVLVTGGAGYIGSICTEQLLDAGHQVTVYDNLSEGHHSAVDPRAQFVLGHPEKENDLFDALKQAEPEAIL